MLKVREYMNPSVIFFTTEDSIFDAAKVFSEKHITGAPVVESDKVIGMISISDIVRFMSMKLKSELNHMASSTTAMIISLIDLVKTNVEFKSEMFRISKTKVKDVMHKELIFTSPDANLFEAATLMEKYDVNRLPVIEDNKLVGIISRADLVRSLIE